MLLFTKNKQIIMETITINNQETYDPDKHCCEKWYKDFCQCMKSHLRSIKNTRNASSSNGSITYLEKHKIEFKDSGVENVVITSTWPDEYRISLKTFKFKKSGQSKWIDKMKKKWIGISDTFKFGKNKGKLITDVIKDNPSYFIWLMDNTDFVVSPDIMKQVTLK